MENELFCCGPLKGVLSCSWLRGVLHHLQTAAEEGRDTMEQFVGVFLPLCGWVSMPTDLTIARGRSHFFLDEAELHSRV